MPSLGQFFAGMSRRGRTFARNESASPAVEFALVFPIFIAVVLATLQAATIFLVGSFFEFGGGRGRQGRSDQPDRVADGRPVPDRGLQSADGALHMFAGDRRTRAAAGWHDQSQLAPAPVQRQRNPRQHAPVDVGASAGAAGADMLLVVMYPWPVYGGPLGLNFANLGSGQMLMTSTQVFRIEPKPLS